MKSTLLLITCAIAAAVAPPNEETTTLAPASKDSTNEPAVQVASKFENSRQYGESMGSWGDDRIRQMSPMNQWNTPNQWGQNSQWGQGGWNNQWNNNGWNNNGWNTGGQWVNGQWRRNAAQQANNLKAAAAVIAGFAAFIF